MLAATDALAVWSLAISIIGVVVTVGGFALALQQLRRTATATRAAEAATRKAQQLIAGAQVQVSTAQLVLIQQQVQLSLSGTNASAAGILGLWRVAASHTQGVLERDGSAPARVLQGLLATSTALAADAEEALAYAATPVVAATVEVRGAISAALNQLNVYVASTAIGEVETT